MKFTLLTLGVPSIPILVCFLILLISLFARRKFRRNLNILPYHSYLYKKDGNKDYLNCYRPIAILTTSSKVFYKFLFQRINDFTVIGIGIGSDRKMCASVDP